MDNRTTSSVGTTPRVPAPLKWAIILGAMIPAACTAFFFFMMIGFGNGWGTSHTDPAPIALGVFALVLVVHGLPGALLWHGVRGVRPVFLAIQTIGAIILCCLFLLLGIYWFVLHFLLLYNSSVTEYLQACRAARKAERGADRSTGTPPRVHVSLMWAIILLPMILCQGCLSQRNGKPFTRTRNTMEELDRNRYTMFPVIGFCMNFCALPINFAADVVGLPVDLAIQAFGSARICVVDEKGNPVPETDAIIELVSGAPFFDYAVLHGRTDQKGNYRIRRRISMENGFGWEPRFVLLSKEGFCPVREVDFSAFTTSNVVTVTMPRFDSSGGYVIERTANDPACRFPPWPKMDEEWFISIGIQCARAKIYPEESWNREKWHGYDASPFDLILSIGNHRNHGLRLTLTSARHEEARVANVPINPEGQNIVPKWAQFDSTAYLSANDFVGDNPRRAILFRLATASKENQYQYGRIDFYWENGLPVGIRRIHFFDPKEQDIVPEPGPSRYFEKTEEKVSRRSKNTGNRR